MSDYFFFFCLIISYGVQYFSTTFAKVIRLLVKPAMIAKLPPSKKLSLVSRRGNGKRVSKVMSFVEKKKKKRVSDINKLHGLWAS